MNPLEKFTIEIQSRAEPWWRFNAALMCGAFDARQNRIGFSSVESYVAPVGSDLETLPEGLDPHRKLTLETVPCEGIVLYIYIVPHTLPRDRAICGYPPFPLEVKVLRGKTVVHHEKHPVNQWGGASIEIKTMEEKEESR